MPLAIVNHVFIRRDGRSYVSLGARPSLQGEMLMNPIWRGCFAANHRVSDELSQRTEYHTVHVHYIQGFGEGLVYFVLVTIFN